MATGKLIQPLTNAKVNDIWHSGFCEATVEHARLTSANDSASRIKFIRTHIKTCVECRNANLLKNAEREVAQQLGPKALRVFTAGGNIATFDGFKEALHKALDELMKSGLVGPDYVHWMARIAKRAGKNYEDQRGKETDET